MRHSSVLQCLLMLRLLVHSHAGVQSFRSELSLDTSREFTFRVRRVTALYSLTPSGMPWEVLTRKVSYHTER